MNQRDEIGNQGWDQRDGIGIRDGIGNHRDGMAIRVMGLGITGMGWESGGWDWESER